MEFRIGTRDYGEVAASSNSFELAKPGGAVSCTLQSAPRQRGVALIVALLVVALATVLIASLLDRGELGLARTRNQLLEAQAGAYAQGLEAYAARVLQQDWALNGGGADSNGSMWAVPLPPTPVPGGTIAATMRDRNGCFNLNNLADADGAPNPPWMEKFRRLLTALRLDPNLADAVGAWQDSRPGNEIHTTWPSRWVSRGQAAIYTCIRIRLVKAVGGDVYTALAPRMRALPRGTKINVNTASVPVLMTLAGVTTEQLAQRVWQEGRANYPTWRCNRSFPASRPRASTTASAAATTRRAATSRSTASRSRSSA